MLKSIKIFSILSILSAGIFLLLLKFFSNGNIMIVNMQSKSGYPMEAELYYTNSGKPFSDSRMSRRYRIYGNNYYFRLPSFDKIQYARFDPAKREDIFLIKNVKIITNRWLKTYLYSVDIKKSKPANQIVNFKAVKDGIKFKASGRDPQININLNRTLVYKQHNYHIDLIIISFLIALILIFLYNIYKKEELTTALVAKLILYSIFLSFAFFKVNYYKEKVYYLYSPDTIAHLSYIEYIHNNKELIPNFKNMYMITNKSAGNYLGHPPLYYYLMNLVYNNNSIDTNKVIEVDKYRALNCAIFIFSIVLLFYIGFSAKLSILGDFVYLSIISSIPMYAYLGANITNDNLAILGGVIFGVGLYRLIKQNFTNFTYFLIGIGAFIAYFSKLTAGLLVFFALVGYILYIFNKKRNFNINFNQALILIIFVIPILAYQVYILYNYHAIVPTLNVTHPQEYLHSPYYVPVDKRKYLTVFEWLSNYWSNIHSGWFGILSHHSLVKTSILDYIGLLVLHIFALIGIFVSCKKYNNQSFCIFGKITFFAFFVVAIIQVTFGYITHLHSGYTGGLQTRYLLPFMFTFAILSSLFVEKFIKYFWWNIIVILLSIQAIYSDFFYFLKYYI